MIFKTLQTLDKGTLHINFFRVVLPSCRSVAPSLNVLIKRWVLGNCFFELFKCHISQLYWNQYVPSLIINQKKAVRSSRCA